MLRYVLAIARGATLVATLVTDSETVTHRGVHGNHMPVRYPWLLLAGAFGHRGWSPLLDMQDLMNPSHNANITARQSQSVGSLVDVFQRLRKPLTLDKWD